MLSDVDPALEKQRAATALKAGKTFSQRISPRHTQVPKPTTSYITMIKHSAQTRANPSFINVTADVVAEKGLPVPLLPRQWMQHTATLTCHGCSINQSLGGKRKHSSSEQTRTHKHLRRDQDIHATLVTGLCTAWADRCAEQRQQYRINLQFAVPIKTGHCFWCQLQQLVLAVWMPKAERRQYF